MKLSPAVFALAFSASLCFAQENPNDEPGITKKSAAYHAYRLEETEPVYSLHRVRALINKIKFKEDEGGDSGTSALTPKEFRSLSNRAKFTYCMIHGELSGQNCDGMPGVVNEENKLFAFPPGPFGEAAEWSERQQKFLHGHRGTVIALLRKTMHSKNRAGTNLKKAILELDAAELIPDMVRMYKRSAKDHDLLTVMSVLMKDLKYQPYMKTDLFRKLYSGEANYKTSIPLTPYVAQTIIADALAMARKMKV